MRTLVALALALALAAAAAAQDATPADVPSGTAVIEGRVVAVEGQTGVGDVGVILYSLLPSGDPGLRQGRADAEGRFRFEGVSGDPDVVYLVGTRVGGVPFGARVVFQEGETVHAVEIEVAEPSRDVSAITVGEPELRLEQGCSDLRVHHLRTLTNDSDRVIHVPAEDRAEAEALFEIVLPEGATEIQTPVGTAADSFEREGRRLRFFGPVHPGRASVEFGYGLPLASASPLELGLPAGADDARILAPPGVRVQGEGFREEGELPMPTGVHRALRAGAIAPGESLRLEIAFDEAARGAVAIAETRLWLELDDAAMDVNELYQLRVEGDLPLASDTGAPLLCISMPPGAESLRFSDASLQMGLSRDPGGALTLRGPIPAGDSSLSLRYRLTVASLPVTFERRLDHDVDLLTLLVADTGIIPETDRLHRRRPIRTEDRSYLHLEAFGIEGGETISLDLRPVPERLPLPAVASTGVVLLVAIGALFYLIAPLRRASDEADGPVEPGISRERQAIYTSIEDLDEDFETGKVSAEDHERMRGELRARAVALLQAERAASEAQPAPAARFCTSCGTATQPGDRFCAQCGNALRPPPPSS